MTFIILFHLYIVILFTPKSTLAVHRLVICVIVKACSAPDAETVSKSVRSKYI